MADEKRAGGTGTGRGRGGPRKDKRGDRGNRPRESEFTEKKTDPKSSDQKCTIHYPCTT